MSNRDDEDDPTTSINILRDLVASGSARGYLMVLASGAAPTVGKMYRLDRPHVVVGRSSEADVIIDDEGISRRHAQFVRGDDGSYGVQDLGSTNGTLVNGHKVSEARLKDGDKIQIGSTTVLMFAVKDALEEQFAQTLYESATRDSLTHVLNRRAFGELLKNELAYARRRRAPLSLLMIDVDHFKAVNDTYGHLAGDAVLAGVAKALAGVLRTEDILARYGGEEFAVLLRETDVEPAARCAERCRKRVEDTEHRAGEHEVWVTISIGAATLVDFTGTPAEVLVRLADQCLYEAKKQGRNRLNAVRHPPLTTPPQPEIERRRHARVETDLNCTLWTPRGKSAARIKNLSVFGAMALAPTGIARVGSALAVHLDLDEQVPAVDARVVWAQNLGSETRYGVEFQQVTDQQRARLVGVIDAVLTGPGLGTRQHPRVSQRLELNCKSADEFRALMIDISRGGLALSVEQPLNVGDPVSVTIMSADAGSPVVDVTGEIVHVCSATPTQYRVGVRFLPLPAETQATLDALLRFLASR